MVMSRAAATSRICEGSGPVLLRPSPEISILRSSPSNTLESMRFVAKAMAWPTAGIIAHVRGAEPRRSFRQKARTLASSVKRRQGIG